MAGTQKKKSADDHAERLNDSFSSVGKEYGYETVTAKFQEFKEFKVKWRRSCGWAEFEVSDYMKDAPDEALNGLAETIFSRMSRKVRERYPKAMLEWVTSDEFIRKKQPVYLMRSRNLTRSPKGEHIDLSESYERLVDMGLVKKDDDILITWTKHPNVKRVGHCSVLMKVVMISSLLDTAEMPAFVIDYVLYHELIHLVRGFDPFDQKHKIDFTVLERHHPMREEAEEWLHKMNIFL